MKKKRKKKHNKIRKKQLKRIYKNKLCALYYISRESFLITKLFISFLKSHNALNQYISNLKKGKQQEDYSYDEKLFDLDKLIITNYYIQKSRDYYDIANCVRLINNAFVWDYTKEGLGYWGDLNQKWLQVLNSLPYIKLSLYPSF